LTPLAILLCASLLFVFGSRAVARRFLFPAQDVRRKAALPGFVEHRLVAGDGVVVRALELRAAGAAPVVVHFHNNREMAEDAAGVAYELAARGLGVMLVEYRGYGASTGASPSEEGLYADAEAALDLLAARGVGPERIVLWGTSLGTGVAAEMARRGRGGRLVLVTPYTSIPDLVANVAPFLPANLLVADHFDTLAKARSIRVPTIVVHGDADEIVPFGMGQRIAAAIPGARLLRIAGGHHGDLLRRARASIVDAIAGATGALES
jgi:hypothetical protein